MGFEGMGKEGFRYEEILSQDELTALEEEFSRLGKSCFLDHTGATLYAKSQIDSIHSEMQSNLFSNPHSRNPSSSITTDAIDYIRLRILHHFGTNADDYSVIFTSGATSAMKLLAESFRFNGGSFAYLEESHTSVVGMRGLVKRKDGGGDQPEKAKGVYCLAKTTLEELMDSAAGEEEDKCGSATLISPETEESHPNSLMAFPAACNFSGYKYPLEWIPRIQNGNCFHSLDSSASGFTYVDDLHEGATRTKNVGRSEGAETKEIKSNLNAECWVGHGKWFVLLDAASFVSTNALNLSLYPADFIPISFYKMFGFPTGLGALLVRNESSHVLKKDYFGGGTVNIAIPSKPFHVMRHRLHERFEDGTISFLSILALRHGFDTLTKLGRSLDTISTRTFRLAQYFYKWLSSMKYLNGQPVAQTYSDTTYESPKTQGPIVTFNLLRPDGAVIGYSEMEQIAYLHDVHLRYGCFCNPGACRRHLKLHPDEVLKHFEAGHVCGDMRDLIDGKPTGAIRVSFGYMTRQRDVDLLLTIIHNCWISPFSQVEVNPRLGMRSRADGSCGGGMNNGRKGIHRPDLLSFPSQETHSEGRKLLRIFVYPIKSCAPFEVSKAWAMGPRGLLYDREWLIMNSSGVPLTQKREPKLCQVCTRIDISNRRLVLSFQGHNDFSVPLEFRQQNGILQTFEMCNSKVCGDMVSGMNCGDAVNQWLSDVLDRPGLKLIRITPDFKRKPRNVGEEISFVNNSQCLAVSIGSLRRLAQELADKGISFLSDNDEEGERGKYMDPTLLPPTTTTSTNRKTNEAVSEGGTPISSITRLGRFSKGSWSELLGSTNLQIRQTMENLMDRFRPNFVISATAYEEEEWEEVRIGSILFKSGGPCQRCATICLDQRTGHRSSEPLLTLSAGRGGKANFGIHLYILPHPIIPIEEWIRQPAAGSAIENTPLKTIHVDNGVEVTKIKSQEQTGSKENGDFRPTTTFVRKPMQGKENGNSTGNFRRFIDNID